MKLNIFSLFSKHHESRGFKAAKINRLSNDWATQVIQINQDLKTNLKLLKARCREAAKNNPHMKKYIEMRKVNIVGDNGIRLICSVKDEEGNLDTYANDLIEASYKDFSRKDFFAVTGTLSRRDVEKLLVSSLAFDGEFFCRLIRNYNNKYHFSIEVLDSYLCDIDYTTQLADGNWVINGVEIDEFGKPVNYYFIKSRPDNYSIYSKHIVLPAEDIIHVFYNEFPNQTRGIPLAAVGIPVLNELQGYTEAEIIAARVAASKMGFYKVPHGNDIGGNSTEINTPVQEVSPGMLEALPEGWDFTSFNPAHPTGNHETFVKATLRELANAWNVAYNEFANDLEGVNFSSIRQGVLFERDCWKDEQNFIIEHFETKIFNEWLKINLLIGNLKPLSYSDVDKFLNSDRWQGKRWLWVDPLKDAQTNKLMVENGWKTNSQVTSEQGGDFYDNLHELKKEKETTDERPSNYARRASSDRQTTD